MPHQNHILRDCKSYGKFLTQHLWIVIQNTENSYGKFLSQPLCVDQRLWSKGVTFWIPSAPPAPWRRHIDLLRNERWIYLQCRICYANGKMKYVLYIQYIYIYIYIYMYMYMYIYIYIYISIYLSIPSQSVNPIKSLKISRYGWQIPWSSPTRAWALHFEEKS